MYAPRNMHSVRALSFVGILIQGYFSSIRTNHTVAPVPEKQPWRICVKKSHEFSEAVCFRWWLVAYSAPSHYIKQCWVIVNWTLRNKLQWNFNHNRKLFIHEDASEISSAKWRPCCPGGDELTTTSQANQCAHCMGHTARCSIGQLWRNFADDLRPHYKNARFIKWTPLKTPYT